MLMKKRTLVIIILIVVNSSVSLSIVLTIGNPYNKILETRDKLNKHDIIVLNIPTLFTFLNTTEFTSY